MAHIMFQDAESVKRNFIRNGFAFYTVCDANQNIIWLNQDEDNLEAAADQLEEDLKSIRAFNNASYVVKQFDKVPNGGLKKGSEPTCITTFKQVSHDFETYKERQGDYRSGMREMMEEMRAEIRGLKERLEDDGEADEQLEMEATTWQTRILGSIVSHPSFEGVLTNIAANLLTNLTTTPMQQPQQLAGTNESITDDDKLKRLQTALDLLFGKGIKLEHIEHLAAMSKEKLSMLLSFLK